jgi:biopolymer transport protein ExbD
MGMSMGGGGGAKSDINVTPLVDVCLVLLIIFMVMVPRNVPEISVRIPPESKQKQIKPPSEEPLVIGMGKEGGLTLNRNPIDKTKLSDELRRQLEFREKKAVFVDFDDDVRYGKAVEVLDLAKRSGAEVLGIMKNKDRKTPDKLEG